MKAQSEFLLGGETPGIADVVIDHGLQRFHPYAASSTLLNVETLEVVRHGSCFADIAYILQRHFGLALAPPTARAGSQSMTASGGLT